MRQKFEVSRTNVSGCSCDSSRYFQRLVAWSYSLQVHRRMCSSQHTPGITSIRWRLAKEYLLWKRGRGIQPGELVIPMYFRTEAWTSFLKRVMRAAFRLSKFCVCTSGVRKAGNRATAPASITLWASAHWSHVNPAYFSCSNLYNVPPSSLRFAIPSAFPAHRLHVSSCDEQ